MILFFFRKKSLNVIRHGSSLELQGLANFNEVSILDELIF